MLHRCPKEVKESAYITLVRPVLEYAAITWDPHQFDNIEMIQRRTARYVMEDY